MHDERMRDRGHSIVALARALERARLERHARRRAHGAWMGGLAGAWAVLALAVGVVMWRVRAGQRAIVAMAVGALMLGSAWWWWWMRRSWMDDMNA